MRKLYIVIFILFFFTINTIAQNKEPLPPPPSSKPNNLEPVDGIFNALNFKFEYYSKVRIILFKNLSDLPEIRFLVIPSFSPESVLD
ncbi:MAG TPA: hypothetical protein VJ954_00610, partial [Ignavibacteriaceae bacterium]|nr:hypothetical protein [Ignavibacteriaceae bacterium]